MEPARYPSPVEEAISHGSQRVAQLASLAAAMGQVVIQRRVLQDAAAASASDQALRILRQQEDALREQARITWTPAHDRDWLAAATFTQTARAWASAAGYADTDPSAAAAQRKCEDRLRLLHPYAMARYDRLRDDGLTPLDAMRETAPMFASPPHVRTGYPAPVPPQLTEQSADRHLADAGTALGPAPPPPDQAADLDEQARLRGHQIIAGLQARARATGRSPLGADELAIVLETVTNLSEELIAKLSRETTGNRPEAGHGEALRTAAECFPHTAAEAIQASVIHRTTQQEPQPSAAVHKATSPMPPRLGP